ncbi:MAG: hypothetical protein LBN05_06670 [Oscillospiraceae bacterium]|jgi:hypothetical protein|nr:hypothetical protein [Oscillospiraceae bacterium]
MEAYSHNFTVFELDELYWFLEKKADTATRENVYLMTMISREPRQIKAFRVAQDKCAWRIQEMVDEAPAAKKYCSDGYVGYLDVDYYGADYVRNIHDKKDTHNVESVNADLRHYIPGLRRRSRCFYRSIDTLEAVIDVFVDAFNEFGAYKQKYSRPTQHRAPDDATKHLHHFKDLPHHIIDFVDIL